MKDLGRLEAHKTIDEIFTNIKPIEAAALWHYWDVWGRPKQVPKGHWRTRGYLTGRGFGKTYAISRWIHTEVQEGRASQICLMAQDEANAISLQVLGPSGLIATAPPWFRPTWEATKMVLTWPNGAWAIVRTPEVPGKIRGFDYDLVWLTEIQSWPVATRDEALSNVKIATRVGLARLVWDATPKRRHPLLKELLSDVERYPEKHVAVRGSTHENTINLANEYVEELEIKYGGTQKGLEEIEGVLIEDSEGALVKQEWIDRARRPMPPKLLRRAIGVDCAVTARKGSDRTGIIEAGLDLDHQGVVIQDLSGKYQPHEWATLVCDTYVKGKCDLVVIETNKGGDLVTQNLRAVAATKGLRVVVVGKDENPEHTSGVIFVKERFAKGTKEDRAQPVATAYERGRVSHVLGSSLTALEDTLTSWEPEPGSKSPDDLDALTHVMVELLGLVDNKPDKKAGFEGIQALSQAVNGPSLSLPSGSISNLFGPLNSGKI